MSEYPRHATSTVAVGDEAPDFTLSTHNEGELNLAWYRTRKSVLLAFYPADWTPVCASQIPGYQQIIDLFEEHNCQLLGISCDSIPCHQAWAKSLGGLSFPLMSDFYPHGDVARKYGVLNSRGYAERSLFLVDRSGIIRFIEIVHPAEIPDTDRLFHQIRALPEGPSQPDDFLKK